MIALIKTIYLKFCLLPYIFELMVVQQNISFAFLLLTKDIKKYRDDDGNTALMYALKFYDENSALFLLNANADITICNNQGMDVIAYAMMYSNKNVFDKLLNKYDNINQYKSIHGTSLVDEAIMHYNYEKAIILLEHGCYPPSNIEMGYHMQLVKRYPKLYEMLKLYWKLNE
jgi:ankyrin repeat protein